MADANTWQRDLAAKAILEDVLRRHHANRHHNNGEEKEGENNRSANFVLLGFEVVVVIVCHAAKIAQPLQLPGTFLIP